MPERTALSRRKLLAAGAVSGLALAGLADLGTRRLVVERRELRLPRWDADGFKVAFLSDTHLNDRKAVEHCREAVQLALDEKPDVLVHGGDFTSIAFEPYLTWIGEAFEPLGGSNVPAFTVLGNHDNFNGYGFIVKGAVAKTKLRLLDNELAETQGVTIGGVDDLIHGTPDWSCLRAKAVSRSFLALVHEPDWPEFCPANVSLQLSGHSHGGQICLPGGIPVHTPYGARRYKAGFYEDAKVPLYVTRGIGTIGMNWRLFCPPEVTILTLRST